MSAQRAVVPDELAEHMPLVARALFGDPNPLQSKPGKPRWGNKGSLAIDERRGVWFDHELGAGGGLLDLIKREKGLIDREAFEWLESIGCRVNGAAGGHGQKASKPNGAGSNGSKHHQAAPQETGTKELLATYDYLDESGARLFQVVRFGFRKPDGTFLS